MSNQTPLNPDALAEAIETIGLLNVAIVEPAIVGRLAIETYLAVAQPEVNSVEELDKLPVHSYVQGDDGFKHAKDWNGGWHLIVNRPPSAPHLSGSIELPARVLYFPEVNDA